MSNFIKGLRKYNPKKDTVSYKIPQTLGNPEVRMAMDSKLEESGFYGLLKHSLDLGALPCQGFVGYSFLQNIAQNGLLRACIDTIADDMTKEGLEGDKTLLDAMEKHNVLKKLHQVAAYCLYYGGCLVFIDTNAPDTSIPLNLTKYSNEAKAGFLKNLQVIEPVNVTPSDYQCTNPLKPDYMIPNFWYCQGVRVHKSRVIHVVQNEPPLLLKPAYNFFGIPHAQLLWDYIAHYTKNRDSANRLLDKVSMVIFKTNMADMLAGTNEFGDNDFDSRMRFLAEKANSDSVLALDKETEDVDRLEATLSGVTDIVKQSLEAIVCINRTPAVKLLGQSPMGFSTGTADLQNYYDFIESQQNKILYDPLNTLARLVALSEDIPYSPVSFKAVNADKELKEVEINNDTHEDM